MTRQLFSYGLALAACLPTLATLPSAQAENLPFKMIGGGSVEVWNERISATGQATHLGRWDADGQAFLGGEDGLFTLVGYVYCRAANGDVLYAEFLITSLGEYTGDPGAFTGSATCTFVFKGGTGRFANATGFAEGDFLFSVEQIGGLLSFEFSLDGEISY